MDVCPACERYQDEYGDCPNDCYGASYCCEDCNGY